MMSTIYPVKFRCYAEFERFLVNVIPRSGLIRILTSDETQQGSHQLNLHSRVMISTQTTRATKLHKTPNAIVPQASVPSRFRNRGGGEAVGTEEPGINGGSCYEFLRETLAPAMHDLTTQLTMMTLARRVRTTLATSVLWDTKTWRHQLY